jgi:AmiR/NasT family two-component response regulator
MPAWLNTAPAQTRTQVWVAMGMAMAKYDLTAADAIALLRAYAFGHDQLLDDVATALIDGQLTLAEMKP